MKVVKLTSLMFWLAVLLLPLTQNVFHFAHEIPLAGAYVKPVKPRLSSSTWFNSSYQDSMNIYVESSIGFHSLLVRIRNQIDFSAFARMHGNDIIKGKNGELFEKLYIEKYYGIDTSDQETFRSKMPLLKFSLSCITDK